MAATRTDDPRRRRRRAAAMIALVLAATSLADSAIASPHRARPAQEKPTVVLIHGGWADSSGWNSQLKALQRRGYQVIAPANPLRGLTSDAAYVHSVLEPSTARSCSSAIPTAAP